jgi:hypothetical protein
VRTCPSIPLISSPMTKFCAVAYFARAAGWRKSY